MITKNEQPKDTQDVLLPRVYYILRADLKMSNLALEKREGGGRVFEALRASLRLLVPHVERSASESLYKEA